MTVKLIYLVIQPTKTTALAGNYSRSQRWITVCHCQEFHFYKQL